MKVYCSTMGEYSSYRIIAVFSKKEDAIKCQEAMEPDNDIVEYELDQFPRAYRDGFMAFRVWMYRNGDNNVGLDDSESDDTEEISVQFWSWESAPKNEGIYARIYAKSKEHATKIANEKRAELIASGEWDAEIKRQKTKEPRR